MTYRTHTADRAAGQRWLTVLIHPDGHFADHHEHPQTLTWTSAPAGDLLPGDVVSCHITVRSLTTLQHLIFVGLTPDGRAIATRLTPANDLETYYVLTLKQLTRTYRPQRQHSTLHHDRPHFQPWQTLHSRELIWLPEVAAPYTLGQPFQNSRGVTLRIAGTDVCTLDLILKPDVPDDLTCLFSLPAQDLRHLRPGDT